MTCRARLASRFPPLLSRCRTVFPLDASMGETPQSLANAASEPMRSGLSPRATSRVAADTHKHFHVAHAADELGRPTALASVPQVTIGVAHGQLHHAYHQHRLRRP